MENHEDIATSDAITYSLGGSKNDIRLSFGEYNGSKTVTIRRWYFDAKSGRFLPTRKGITMMAANFRALLTLLDKHRPEIDGLIKPVKATSPGKRLAPSLEGATQDAMISSTLEFSLKSMPLEVPWDYQCLGSRETLYLNADHPLAKMFSEAGTNSNVAKLIEAIAFSCTMVVRDEVTNGGDFLEMFLMNFSSRLRRTMRRPGR